MTKPPKPIGYFWFIWAGGKNPERAKKEFYAIRKLPNQKDRRQVQVKFLDSMVWINMPLNELHFYQRKENH